MTHEELRARIYAIARDGDTPQPRQIVEDHASTQNEISSAQFKRISRHFAPTEPHALLEQCPKCGCERITYRQTSRGIIIAYCLRADCNYWRTVPKQKNLEKRTSGMLLNWSRDVRQKYNFRCAICDSDINVEAHHIIPVAHSIEFKFNRKNGIALCRECHKLVHFGK